MVGRRIVAAVAVLAVGLLVGAFGPAAQAGKPKAKTTVTGSLTGSGSVAGEVMSVKACEPRRDLVLIQKYDGQRSQFATTRSKRDGSYDFGPKLYIIGAEYSVKAERRARARVICKSDRVPVPIIFGP